MKPSRIQLIQEVKSVPLLRLAANQSPATAYREPNYRVQLFLFGAIRLKYLALVVIGIDVLSITSSNAGGHIAHLGGALAN